MSVCNLCIEKKSRDGTRLSLSSHVIPLGHQDVAYLALISRNSWFPLQVGNRFDSSIAIRPLVLTHREHEILELLAAGKTAKPIAAALALAVPTVRTHIQHILRKIEVHSCLEAVSLYLRMSGGHPSARS